MSIASLTVWSGAGRMLLEATARRTEIDPNRLFWAGNGPDGGFCGYSDMLARAACGIRYDAPKVKVAGRVDIDGELVAADWAILESLLPAGMEWLKRS